MMREGAIFAVIAELAHSLIRSCGHFDEAERHRLDASRSELFRPDLALPISAIPSAFILCVFPKHLANR